MNIDTNIQVPKFDRERLRIKPLDQRVHDLDLSDIKLDKDDVIVDPVFETIAGKIKTAKKKNAPVILMMGAHVIRSGVQCYIIDLMKQGYISCIAMNGACVIHDYEFALIGGTTESVTNYIPTGEFGHWQETARINDIVNDAATLNIGIGEAVGKEIHNKKFPFSNISILSNAHAMGIPVTVHVSIGADIVHQHKNCDGAAWGKTSYADFLTFVSIVEQLQHGVLMSFGSSVMAPEIFLKALSMARNANLKNKNEIRKFTTLVCDLVDLPVGKCTV